MGFEQLGIKQMGFEQLGIKQLGFEQLLFEQSIIFWHNCVTDLNRFKKG